MNCLVRGSIVFAAAAAVWACGTNLDENGDTLDHLTATPTFVAVSNVDSQTVDIEAVNPQGQQLVADFALGTVGAGLNVRRDTAFQPIGNGQTNPTRARFIVRASDPNTYVNSSFTVEAGGKSVTVPVKIFPAELSGVVLSNSTPAIGDTVAVTAPAGVRFTNSTTITTPTDTTRRIANVGISADSATLFILPGPDIADRELTFGNVQVTYLPGVNFNVATDASITTGPLPNPLPTVTVSNPTPAVGDTVTLTAPAPFGFTAASRVTLTGTGTGNAFVDVSADHTTLRFIVGPNSNGAATVSNVALGGQSSLGVMNLTTAPITSPAPPPFAPTFSTATPAAGEQVKMTAPNGYKLLPTVTVSVGGAAAFIDSVSADSTMAWFVPRPGTSGAPVVGNAVLSFLTSVPLTVTATSNLTVGPSPFTGTDDPATAPALPIPAQGSTVTFYDGGAFDGAVAGPQDRLYSFTVAQNTTLKLTLNWNNTADIDILWTDNPPTDFVTCFGGATGSRPEVDTCTFGPGSYLLVVDLFSGAVPGVLKFTLEHQ